MAQRWTSDLRGCLSFVICYFTFLFLCCGRVFVMSLPTLSVVSVVQITLNSHVRNLIEVIIFTLCFMYMSFLVSLLVTVSTNCLSL